MGVFVNKVLNNQSRDELLELLQGAEVSVGHWNGRRIQLPGFDKKETFSKVAGRVETLYQETLSPIQRRQKEYELNSKSGIDLMPIRGRHGLLVNLALAPMLAPLKLAGDAICWITTPYPQVSEMEEKEIKPVLQWRRQVDGILNSLYGRSQKEIDRQALNSCMGKVYRRWDSFLDRWSNWRNTHWKDESTFQTMIENRKNRAEVLSTSKSAVEILAETVVVVDDLLTYAKYRRM